MKTRSVLALSLVLVAASVRPGAGSGCPPQEPAARSEPCTPRTYAAPDRCVDGFPVWLGADGKLDRVVVAVEGFDLYNRASARDLMQLIAPAADALRAAGVDVLAVDFPDSRGAPDALAPHLARAIRAAAAVSSGTVAVAGFSAGGIVARWALVEAENAGTPLPVDTLLLVDTPNRGARLHPALQALTLRYGSEADRTALTTAGARALLTCAPKSVRWKRVGPPGARRRFPAGWQADGSAHAGFYARLRALNDRGGYPRSCRNVAVALGSRQSSSDLQELLHVWLPFGASWTCRAEAEDRAAGSLLPDGFGRRFRVRMPLGLAGSYMRGMPTFVATESALDAAPGETPPFDAWFARPDGAPATAHDEPAADAVRFAVQVLLERKVSDR